MTKRRVFLTGASGFVGSRLVAELTKRGFAVRALQHRGVVPAGPAEIVSGSLERVSELGRLVEGVDAIVHAAALLDPIEDETLARRINHEATAELARLAAGAGVGTFVHLSSQAAVGYTPGSGLVRTDAPCSPTTTYGRSKLAAERALAAMSSSLRVVIVRPPTVYGPGERRNFLALVRAIDTGLFPVLGRGDNRMSFCAVQNLAHAIGFCLENDAARGILHVADEPVMTFRETVQRIARALGRRPLPVSLPLTLARAAALGLELGFRFSKRQPPLSRARLRTLTADCALDTSSSRRIGLEPITSFAEAVRETVDEYRSAGLLRGPRTRAG